MKNFLRALCMAVVLLCANVMVAPAVYGAQMADDLTSALSDVDTNMDTSGTKMAPILDEFTAVSKWVVWALWYIGPLIVFGGLILWGVIQARGNESAAARKTFIAVGIGVIFYFGVLSIFF